MSDAKSCDVRGSFERFAIVALRPGDVVVVHVMAQHLDISACVAALGDVPLPGGPGSDLFRKSAGVGQCTLHLDEDALLVRLHVNAQSQLVIVYGAEFY